MYAELLTSEQAERIHEASLEILETVGMMVRSEKARACFAEHGCHVDSETLVVTFPHTIVEHWRAACPPTFALHGRDPQYDRTIPDHAPLISTASAAPNIIDPETGQERRARSDDIARIGHLVNELSGFDIFQVPTTADDAPPGQFHLSRFYPALKNCLKPITCSAPDAEEARAILRLGSLVAGSEEAYRERPFMAYMCCPLISPLTMDVASTEMVIHFTQEQLPNYTYVVPNAGVTAPLTLLGALAQCNAEFLANVLLVQMTHSGTPLIYQVLPTVADMRTGAYATGGIETGILVMGCAQMARYYTVPCGALVGLPNAKVNDAQSGFETGMSALAALLAGVDFLSIGGVLDGLMTFDFAKAVIDNEIALMLKRVRRGFEASVGEPTGPAVEAAVEPLDEEHLALDVIADVGPGGMFMDHLHTLKHMRTSALLPEIADRDSREGWQAGGALDAHARAMRRVREILARENSAVFAPEVDARIRAEFEGLVAGEVGSSLQ
ncbi:MAG: trimethylamine methyltransferase family protein [Anaerolineae bacterium]|jgi:trimethylamine--corrinoid protein Co-methyltransferase